MFHKCLMGAALAVATVAVALACGPDFPWELLFNRRQTFRTLPVGGFGREVAALVPAPHDGLQPNESEDDRPPEPVGSFETEGLTPGQLQALVAMRNAPNGDAAYRLGAPLPEGVRLYTAGAVDFHHQDWAAALARFAAVLRLPPDERRDRAVWAAFMIGRTRAAQGRDADAALAFAETRGLARAGMPDPMGLGVASFGEEAQLYWTRAWRPGHDPAPDLAVAARLYGEQAARGSQQGVSSLRMMAARILDQPADLPSVLSQPVLRRLLAAYLIASTEEGSLGWYTSPEVPGMIGPFPSTRWHTDALRALTAQVTASTEDASWRDRLAALHYRSGNFAQAAELAQGLDTPLALWIKAKLALAEGRDDLAAALFAQAVAKFPDDPVRYGFTPDMGDRLSGEFAVLKLVRGDFVQALNLLYSLDMKYWDDAAYIAERVLTVDELKAFVARRAAPAVSPQANDEKKDAGPLRPLSHLLARRLMRDGRYSEAATFMPTPELKKLVQDYAAAVAATDTWFQARRARAWFRRAEISRKYGLELFGYEGWPDVARWGGNRDVEWSQAEDARGWISWAEAERVRTSAPVPGLRLHYRYLAVDFARRAAAQLPPRSQAYAAVLCQAAHWMRDTTRFGAAAAVENRALYRQYVENGAHFPWAENFGAACPEPDFDAAATLPMRRAVADGRRILSAHRTAFAFAALALLGLAVWLAVRRRLSSGRRSP